MMGRTVFDVLTGDCSEKIEQLKEYLASGGAKSFDEYKAICGEIKGLFTAISRIQDLQHTMENSDE
jgi:hypothetical protein